MMIVSLLVENCLPRLAGPVDPINVDCPTQPSVVRSQ
jgi:hypothetical protein